MLYTFEIRCKILLNRAYFKSLRYVEIFNYRQMGNFYFRINNTIRSLLQENHTTIIYKFVFLQAIEFIYWVTESQKYNVKPKMLLVSTPMDLACPQRWIAIANTAKWISLFYWRNPVIFSFICNRYPKGSLQKCLQQRFFFHSSVLYPRKSFDSKWLN